jgi:hypothetical protein
MRRWLTSVALGGVAALALAGCVNPAGVDGDLTDDWAAFDEPTVFVPVAGTCHPRFQEIGFLSTYQPVDCGDTHTVETVHLGTFPGKDAERSTPPPAGSPGMRAAFRECDKKATGMLGADWRTGRLTLSVVPPSSYAWTGGARWYRCDLSEIESLDNNDLVARTSSLKDALRGPSPLSYGCFAPKLVDDEVEEMKAVVCSKPHRSEFAGIYTAPDVSYDAFEKSDERVRKGCLAVIASFAKVPNDGDLRYRTGWISYYPREDEWKAGDRGVHCFLWIGDRNLTRSLKRAGTKGLPIT